MSLVLPEGRKSKTPEEIKLAIRANTLKGKVVALYHNDKPSSYPIMRTIGRLLKEKVGVKETFEIHSKAPFSKHPERAIVEALKADAIFTATAD
jgi:hypothetical protein